MLLTRTVLRRKKNASAVLAALVKQAPGILAKIEAYFAPLRGPEQPIADLAGILADLKNALEHVYHELERADDAHLAEVAADRRQRRIRDQTTGELHQILLHFYRTIDNDYGTGTAEETLGLGPGMRPIPDEIYDLARRTNEQISEPGFAIPGPPLQGDGVSVEEFQTRIAGPLESLGDALERIRNQRKQFEVTLQEKLEWIAEFDRVYAFVATWAKAMFLAAGEPELARRIRPKIPRSTNPAADDDTFESEPGLTPAEDEPPAAAPAPPSEAASAPDDADDNP